MKAILCDMVEYRKWKCLQRSRCYYRVFKVKVQWWKPSGTSKVNKELYKNYLSKKQKWVVGLEENYVH